MKIIQYVIVLMLFIVATSYADLIKYTDKDGTLCFADDLGKVPIRYRQNIIRDEEESAAQIINSGDESLKTGSVKDSEKDPVTVCYGLGGLDNVHQGHNVTCFLNARDYPYRLYDVRDRDDIVSITTCAEYWCRLHDKNDSPSCIKETSQKIHWITPFTVIGNRLFPRKEPQLLTELDNYFNVDPKTRVKWHIRAANH